MYPLTYYETFTLCFAATVANHLALAIFRASLAETRQVLLLRFIITYWPSNAFRRNSSCTAFLRHLLASIAIL